MIELHEDLWKQFGRPGHRIGISTNGFVKKNGRAVMGRGCAKQAVELFEDVDLQLGSYLKLYGNNPGYLLLGEEIGRLPAGDRLLILPVKHAWWEKANLDLIKKSISFLKSEAYNFRDSWTFHVPRLGCGNGKLSWQGEISPLMQSLPDNVVVHGG